MTRARGRGDGARIVARGPSTITSRRRLRLTRDPYARRSLAALVIYLLAFGAIVVRLVDVQVVNAEHYADQGIRQRTRTVELAATRGRVYDREGEVLATSIDSATIYADPRAYLPEEREIEGRTVTLDPEIGPEEAAAQLAPLLARDPAWIAEQLRKDLHFVYLGRQLDWEVGEQVLALELPGIGRLVEPKRVYPGGQLAGQIVGFTGIDGDGLHGLELQHDTLLKGQAGQLAYERAEGGLVIALHPSMVQVAAYLHGLSGTAPTRIVRLRPDESIEVLFDDPDGALLSAATVGVLAGGVLVAGSAADAGVLVCREAAA